MNKLKSTRITFCLAFGVMLSAFGVAGSGFFHFDSNPVLVNAEEEEATPITKTYTVYTNQKKNDYYGGEDNSIHIYCPDVGNNEGAYITYKSWTSYGMTITTTGVTFITSVRLTATTWKNNRYNSSATHGTVSIDGDDIVVSNVNAQSVLVSCAGSLCVSKAVINTVEGYEVNYVLDGGTINGSYEVAYMTGVSLALPENVIKVDWIFDGWYDNEEFEGDPITQIGETESGNKTFYAKYHEDTSGKETKEAIEALPETAALTFDDIATISELTNRYNALIPTQKAIVGEETLAILTSAQEKAASILDQRLDDFGDISALTYDPYGPSMLLTLQTYDNMPTQMKNLVSSDYKTKISSLRNRYNIIVWEDVTFENGTYSIFSAAKEKTALTFSSDNNVSTSYYDLENDEYNRSFKWKITRQGESYSYSIVNIYDLNQRDRVLDVAGWGNGLTNDANIALVSTGSTLNEGNTDVFRFSRRLDVEGNEGEYYIRCVYSDGNKYGYVLNRNESTNRVKIGSYVEGEANQLWKVIRVDGDEEYAARIKAAIEALPEIDDLTLENEAEVNAVATLRNNIGNKYQDSLIGSELIEKLNKAVTRIADIKIAEAFKTKMNNLGEITYPDSLSSVHSLRNQYNPMTDDQKMLVGDISILTNAEAYLAAEAQSYMNSRIVKDEITLDDAKAVSEARVAYNALSNEEKALIAENTLNYLLAGECQIAILQLPPVGELTLTNENAVKKARSLYAALTEDQQGLVLESTLDKLVAAETEIEDIKAAKAVSDAIAALPKVGVLTLNDETAVVAARTSYEALTTYQQGKITDDVVNYLVAVETEIIDLHAAKDATDAIEALPSYTDATLDDESSIVAARTQYENLTTYQKGKITDDTLAHLASAEEKIVDIKAANEVIALIEGIGEVANTDESSAKIHAARDGYNALSQNQKALVSNFETLTKAESDYVDLVMDALLELLDFENPTVENTEDVLRAKEYYDNLSEEELALMPTSTVDKILVSEVLIDAILIPNVDEINLENKDAVLEAVANYEALTPEQQQNIPETVVDKIRSSESTIEILLLPELEEVNLEDKEEIDQAYSNYDQLTEAQKELLSSEVVDKILTTKATVEILNLPEYDEIDQNDKDAINTVKEFYDNLTQEQIESLDDQLVEQLFLADITVNAECLPEIEDPSFFDTVKDLVEELSMLGEEQQEKLREGVIDKIYAADAAADIIALPELGDISEEKDAETIQQALEKYEALTEEQQELIPQEVIDTLYSAKATLDIVSLPEQESITSGDTDAINDAYSEYLDLTDGQKELIPAEVVDTLLSSKVTVDILNLPELDMITASDTDAIENALLHFNTLSEAQQNLVPDEVKDVLKASKVTLDIVCLPEIEAVAASSKDEINQVKADYDALSDEQKELLSDEVITKLLVADTTVNALSLPEEAEISIEDKDTIKDLVDEYNLLSDEQKALLSDEVKDKIACSDAIIDILSLPESSEISVNDVDEIESALEKYNTLSDAQKGAVPQNVVDMLYSADATKDIVLIPDTKDLTLEENGVQVSQAVNKYEGLSEDQKALVSEDVVNKLYAANMTINILTLPSTLEDLYEDQEYVSTLVYMYNELPDAQKELIDESVVNKLLVADMTVDILNIKEIDNITATDAEEIENAVAKYNALSNEQKALLDEEVVTKLLTADITVNVITLPEISEIQASDAGQIADIVGKYNELSKEQKALLSDEIVSKLLVADVTSSILSAANDTSMVDLDDADDIAEALEKYNALSEEDQALVPSTAVDKLLASDTIIDILAIGGDNAVSLDDAEEIAAALEKYNGLTTEQKALIGSEIHDRLIAYDMTIDILLIPEANDITLDDKDQIDAALEKYNGLTDDEKSAIDADIVATLSYANMTIKLLSLPGYDDVTLADEALIQAASEEFNAYTPSQKSMVGEQAKLQLTSALKKIADLKEANEVIAMIENMGEVSYTEDFYLKLVAAEDEYSSLSAEQKALVSNYDVLAQARVDYDAIDYVVLLIEYIEGTSFDNSRENAIAEARNHYDVLTDHQKECMPEEAVTDLVNYEKSYGFAVAVEAIGTLSNTDECRELLDDAKELYAALTDAQKNMVPESLLSTYQRDVNVMNVLDKINALGEVEPTQAFSDKLSEAMLALNSLTSEERECLPNADLKTLNDKSQAYSTSVLIDQIGVITWSNNSENSIVDAEASYAALTDDQKALVPNVDVLLQAREDWDAVNAAIEAITGVGDLEYCDICEELLEQARSTYDGLSDFQKQVLPENYIELLQNMESAYAFMEAVHAIGTIENTVACHDLVDEAKALYETLTEAQKKMVPESLMQDFVASKDVIEVLDLFNTVGEVVPTQDCKDKLDAALQKYNSLEAWELEYFPQADIDLLNNKFAAYETAMKINAIGDVDYNDESKAKIDAARASIDALSEPQLALINDMLKQTLIDAETVYEAMKRIEAIGTVEYSDTCKQLIDYAYDYYVDLSDPQKAAVDNVDKLLKAHEDYYAVMEVATMINDIHDIRYDDRSNEAITGARDAYDDLSADQKALLLRSDKKALEDAEAVYAALGVIDAIGTVSYDQDSETAIKEARVAYDKLSDEQKALVNIEDLKTLENSEAAFDDISLKANVTAAVLIVVTTLALGGAFVFLLNELYKFLKNRKGVTIASIAPLPLLMVLAGSYYGSGAFVVLYILIGILVLTLAGAFVLFFINKNHAKWLKDHPEAIQIKEPVQKPKTVEEAAIEEMISEEENTPVQEEPVDEIGTEPVEPIKEPKHAEPVTLKESLNVASNIATTTNWSKKALAELLEARHPDEVEINLRGPLTKTGLPLSDTHFAVAGDIRKCFIYCYQTVGAPVLLIIANEEIIEPLREKHERIPVSAFPKSKDTWYALTLDDSYSKEEIGALLDLCHAYVLGRYELLPTLKKALIKGVHAGGVHQTSKASICEYLSSKYGDTVEVNNRKNFTSTGLPLADTHYVYAKDGKKVCFIYVYETSGAMVLIVKANSEYANMLKQTHPNVSPSAFPYSKEKCWFSVILDDSYSDENVHALLDDVIALNRD